MNDKEYMRLALQLARKNKGNFGKKREGRTVPTLLTRQ